MGFINVINSLFESLRDFTSNSSEFKCSQCLKCKQCIKTLTNGSQVRVFTCPAFYDGINDDQYIDSILPSVQNGLTTDYIEAYNKNRDAIYSYLYNSNALYLESAIPLKNRDFLPITTLNELRYFYQAMECPRFRPFIDSNNILTDNDSLISSSFPEIVDFNSLSKEDKVIISPDNNWY